MRSWTLRSQPPRRVIALANDSDFGLGGSVFTKDIARGKRVARRVETGTMFINNIDWSDAAMPFGGIKNSGYGRELGDMGIQQFVHKKLVRSVDSCALVRRGPAPSPRCKDTACSAA